MIVPKQRRQLFDVRFTHKGVTFFTYTADSMYFKVGQTVRFDFKTTDKAFWGDLKYGNKKWAAKIWSIAPTIFSELGRNGKMTLIEKVDIVITNLIEDK